MADYDDGQPVHDPWAYVPDTGDMASPTADDPMPAEVTDRDDASWVAAADGVLPALDFPDPTELDLRVLAAPRGAVYSGYQPAVRCTDGPTVGCRNLMAWFLGAYSRLGGVNTGIYNCRTQRGAATLSLHGEGRAADLGIRPYSAPWGTALAEALRLKSRELGIQLLIWNRRVWSGSYPNAGWRPYTGTASHTDHIHTELSWRTARDAPLTVAYIAQVMGGGTPTGGTTGGGTAGARVLKVATPPMEGADVQLVQRVLRAWYGLPAAFCDGFYGPGTAAQVKRAQAAAPPQPVLDADGMVGPQTRRKLGIPG